MLKQKLRLIDATYTQDGINKKNTTESSQKSEKKIKSKKVLFRLHLISQRNSQQEKSETQSGQFTLIFYGTNINIGKHKHINKKTNSGQNN